MLDRLTTLIAPSLPEGWRRITLVVAAAWAIVWATRAALLLQQASAMEFCTVSCEELQRDGLVSGVVAIGGLAGLALLARAAGWVIAGFTRARNESP